MPGELRAKKPRNQDEDQERQILVKKAVRGDGAALYSLCENIARDVLFYTRRLMGDKNDAEDVSQEVLLAVCENIRKLREPRAFRVWLSKIISNQVRQHYKKQEKLGVVLNVEDYLESIMEKNEDFLPLEYTESEETRRAVMSAVDALPTRQREAVFLRYYYGLSVNETAEAMGIDASSASKYISVAREKLKTGLESSRPAPEGSHFSLAPLGMVLSEIIRRQSELMAHDPAAASRLLLKCEALIKASPAPLIPATVSSSQAPATATLVSVAAAALVTAGIAWWARPVPAPPQPVIYQPVSLSVPAVAAPAEFDGGVSFLGGVDHGAQYAHRNPELAIMNSPGAEPISWEITGAEDETVLYSGEGGAVAEPLTELLSSKQDGVYTISFLVKAQTGEIYRVQSRFFIRTQ